MPPEARGVTRDAVRMLVATKGTGGLVTPTSLSYPGCDEGDLVVINTSGTLAAASRARHRAGTSKSIFDATAGRTLDDRDPLRRGPCTRCAGGRCHRPRGRSTNRTVDRLLVACGWRQVLGGDSLHAGRVLELSGGPRSADHLRIRAGQLADHHVSERLRAPNQVREMPSAGRPFTPEVVTRLVARGDRRSSRRPPYRRGFARGLRAAIPRTIQSFRSYRAQGQRHAQKRWKGHRNRDDGHVNTLSKHS